MSLDILGPASALNSVTTRPSQTTTYGATRTWFKPCSSLTAQDGTQLTADWLNNMLAQLRAAADGAGIVEDNGDDMLWRVVEVMVPRYCVDTGSVNTLVVANTPPAPAFRAGLTLEVKALHAPTGASTISVDALTSASIARQDGSALIGGEWADGDVILLIGDDTGKFRLSNRRPNFPSSAIDVAGSAPGGGQTASWTIGQIGAALLVGGAVFTGFNLSLSFNGATTGAGGMDTGSMPSSADLSIYAIFNPATNTWSTLGCAGSTSNGRIYSGAHMPAGYTASLLIFACVTNGADFPQFNQINHTVYLLSSNFINNGMATSPTSVSLSTVVPAITKAVAGNANINTSSTAGAAFMGATAGSGSGGSGMVGLEWLALGVTSGPTGLSGAFGFIPLVTAQTLYYNVSASSIGLSAAVDSYQF
jgi:hypothetical protein